MKMEAAAAAIDFNALSRRELQALCKLNGVRANMTNVAMAEALQSLPSVDGIDMIGTTLCLPTPGKSAMKSGMKSAVAAVGEDQHQQHGSPLPRGRRVSVKSPEAIRMDVEEGEDEMKRYLIKEIVRTPGVALRSTTRARATPAPLPTPAPGTLRRSQRSTARKAAAPVEVEVSTTKRTTRTARSKVMIDLDQEEEIAAAPEEKVQEVEEKGVTSEGKCDEPEEEEVTKLLREGSSKAEEPEQDEEVVSSFVPIGSAIVSDSSCDDSKVEEATKPQEVAAIGEEQDLVSALKSAPLPAMEDSPILGVLSKAEATEPSIKNIEDASNGDGEGFGNRSPVLEITEEINRASEDKEATAVEVPKEAVKKDAFNSIGEAADAPNKMLPAAATDDETKVGDAFNDEKEVAADEMPQADLADDESTEEYDLDGESSEESDIAEESSEEVDLDEEYDIQKAALTFDAATEEIDCTSETDEESDETIEESDSTDVNLDSDEEKEDVLKMVETGEVTKEDEESDDSTGEEDDFSADLSPEFDNCGDFNDAETEIPAAAAASSVAKTVVKSLDDSAITEELEVSSEEGEVSQKATVTEEKIDTIVKSLDEFTVTQEVTEEKKESEAAGAKEKKKQNLHEKSLRKLTAMYKERLIAAKEGKRLALAELDDNASVDC